MIVIYAIGFAVAVCLWFILRRRRNKINAELSGGFALYTGVYLKESDLIRILVLEELGRYGHTENFPVTKNRRKRIWLTAIYILVNFLLLMNAHYKGAMAVLCTVIAVLYTFLFDRFDPVGAICKAAKKQPDRDISQIVREMTSEEPPRSLKPLGIGAFVLSLALFFFINANARCSFTSTEGGYSLEKYYPSVFHQQQVQIPETYQGEPVVAIGKRAFEGVYFMNRVTIPETVTLIDSYAFKNCYRLEQIQLPAGLLTLNGESFKNCSALQEIVIPEGVTEIRGNTFEGCTSLQKVVLHDGIVDIHAYAFRNCKKLSAITLPSGLTQIHAYTFENCESLTEINLPYGVTRIGAHAFYHCISLTDVYVPDRVKEIRSSAFRECKSLQEIALPEGVAVDERAFKDSPTALLKKLFTDKQTQQILQEAGQKNAETLYYVYNEDAPDVVRGWDSKTVLIVDDILFKTHLEEGEALQAMTEDTELLEYLETAKKAGFTHVIYGEYSPLASEIVNEPYFLRGGMTVDDMIELCKTSIAEEGNE